MVYASHYHDDFAASEGFGWPKHEAAKHNWQKFMQVKNSEITRLNGAYTKMLASAGKAGVTLLEGRGSLVDRHTVNYVDKNGHNTELTTDKILLAVGGWPFRPSDVRGIEHAITSNEAFYLSERPGESLSIYLLPR
jgi:glutathione reductase (NADPH)